MTEFQNKVERVTKQKRERSLLSFFEDKSLIIYERKKKLSNMELKSHTAVGADCVSLFEDKKMSCQIR